MVTKLKKAISSRLLVPGYEAVTRVLVPGYEGISTGVRAY